MDFWNGMKEVTEYIGKEIKNKIKAFENAQEKNGEMKGEMEESENLRKEKCMDEKTDTAMQKEDQNVTDGIAYKMDDTGNVYMIDGKLQTNITYELNGSIYKTDEQGRIISCEAKPQRTPENPRDVQAQVQAGGGERRPSDQGGHIIGRDLSGDGGAGNLVAMDSRINQSDYKRMENDVKNALDTGKKVTTKTEILYTETSERPDKIKVTVTVDGKNTVYKFDNNLDGSLMNEVPKNGKEVVQEDLKDTKGQISSVKEEYDKEGNLIETTVYITYTDGDGINRRRKVIIDNSQKGGNV